MRSDTSDATVDDDVPRRSRSIAPAGADELVRLVELTQEAVVLFGLLGDPALTNAAAQRLLVPWMQRGQRLDAWRLFGEQADVVRRLAAESAPGPVLEHRRVALPNRLVLDVGLHRLPEGRFAITAIDVTAIEEGERVRRAQEQRLQRFDEELRRAAWLDPSTGAVTIARFTDLADAELERHLRYGRPFAVLLVDVDHKDTLDERHGEGADAVVLRAACRQVRSSLRTLDAVAFGDDGTLHVLLPETTLDQAMLVAERTRRQLGSTAVRMPESRPLRFTVSIGVAVIEAGDALVEHALERARAALSAVHTEGGDKVAGAVRETA